jgi:hypothetical protein
LIQQIDFEVILMNDERTLSIELDLLPEHLHYKDEGCDMSYLDGVTVARNIPAAEMLAGRHAAVLFYDENSTRDAVVIAVYA